jgi:outer membrane protein assembly factor BamB
VTVPAPATSPGPGPALDTTTTLTLLPVADAYVDPGKPTQSFPGQLWVSSSQGNESQQVGYLMFDLTAIPPDAVVSACQLFLTVDGQLSKQIVKVLLVDDDSWTDGITFNTAPTPSATPVGTWLAQSTPRVATNAVNPALVAAVKKGAASQSGRLSLQISSTFGPEGGATANKYFSFESAAPPSQPGSAPRLVIQYQAAARPLARDWPQAQADPRHSGRTAWTFYGTPTHDYRADTPVSGQQLSSPVVIVDDLLYFFTPSALEVLNPAIGKPLPLAQGLTEFRTAALSPGGLLYAAGMSELAAFDLTAGGKKTISKKLNGSSEITAGADGSVYLTQGSTLTAYVRRLGSLELSWTRDLGPGARSPVTLSADGSTGYIATQDAIYALQASDGSELWTYPLRPRASSLTIPVCGRANGLSYFGADDTLYVFRAVGTPLSTFGTVPDALISQPLIDDRDILHVLQSDTLFTVSADGTGPPLGQFQIPGLTAATPIRPVRPVMDGAGNVFILDNSQTLYVCTPDLKLVYKSQPALFSPPNPGLQIAPDGSLFCNSASALFRLTPGVEATVTVDAYQDATCYRAQSSLILDGAALPASASLEFQSGGSITIKPGFTVPAGTEAAFRTGY